MGFILPESDWGIISPSVIEEGTDWDEDDE
jgi:hypothetical protein